MVVKGVFMIAKKINKRPVDDLVAYIRKLEFGIIFTNGEHWKNQRKTFVQLMKNTGFQKQNIETAIDHVWPKLKKAMTLEPSMTIKMFEPMEFDRPESLDQMELALIELLVLTFTG